MGMFKECDFLLLYSEHARRSQSHVMPIKYLRYR